MFCNVKKEKKKSVTHKFLSSSLSSRWLSLSHDFFTLGLSFTPLSHLAFSHKGKLCFNFCFMGFF